MIKYLGVIFIFILNSNNNVIAQVTNEPSLLDQNDHSHKPITIPEKSPHPTLSIEIYKDAISGYNLKIITNYYSLVVPPKEILNISKLMLPTINKETGFIEGHAHLYLNGKKIRRLYAYDTHIPDELLLKGINQITVSINNHAHMYWVIDEKPILATLFIDPTKRKPIIYRFESFPTK